MTEPAEKPSTDPAVDARARRGRNIAIALGLVAFVVLVYVVTLIRMGANAAAPHF